MQKRLDLLKTKIEADPKVGENLFSLDSPEAVQGFLKEQGIEFSLEEINEIKESLVKVLKLKENGELTDEALEDVAGGCAVTICLIAGTLIGGLAGGLAGGAVATNFITERRW